jgi:hypothetical protein
MPERSFGVLVAPREGGSLLTGPMTLAALTLVASAVTRLSGLDHAGLVFCYFKALTGYACFTCGTTRALGHLSRLDVSSAFAVQPLATVAAMFLVLWGAIDTVLLLAAKRATVRLEGRALRAAAVLGVALAVLNWIYLLAAGV